MIGIVIISLVLVFVITILIYKYTNIYDYISFKESLDLTGLPIITFRQGNIKLNFILDTGSNISSINKPIMETLKYEVTDKYAETIGIEGKVVKVPINKVKLHYKNAIMEGEFQELDLSASFDVFKKQTGVNIHGMLGTEFMEKYGYVIDFSKMIAYAKKHRKSR